MSLLRFFGSQSSLFRSQKNLTVEEPGPTNSEQPSERRSISRAGMLTRVEGFLGIYPPIDYDSMSSGLQKLLSELAFRCLHGNGNDHEGHDNERLTASKLRTLFLSENIDPAETFSQYYSNKYPDIFVSFPWDMCLLAEMPAFLDEFEQWLKPLSIGDRIMVSGKRQATIRFIGTTSFGPDEWVGAELDDASGWHDGAVYGKVLQQLQRTAFGSGDRDRET